MKIFGFKNKAEKPTETAIYKMIVDRGNGFYEWNGKLYHSDIVRAAIKPKTKAIGKVLGKHIRTVVDRDGAKTVKINPEPYIRFLLEDPNEFMSGQMLQEKVANMLSLNGNAFILIIRDQNYLPIGLYPIPCVSAEAKYDAQNELYIKFTYQNGKYSEFYYSELIHLRDDYFFNDIFGNNPQEALTSLMDTVSVADQGLSKAIKNSFIIRWLLKYVNAMRPEDIKTGAEEFANNYLSISNNAMGVAATDSKAEAIQVKNDAYVPNALQVTGLVKRIYSFFGTNEKIVSSEYTEDEWVSYYEAQIEPVIGQMSREYTRKLFSRRERGCGNEIVFESSVLTFASIKTKLSLTQFVDRGIMTPNEVRSYFSLAPIPGGDEALLRKDTGKLADGNQGEE